LDKTLITNAAEGKAYFLGTEIQRTSSVKGEIKRLTNVKGNPQRVPTTSTVMKAPLSKLIEKFAKKGFVVWDSKEMRADNLDPQPIKK